MKAPWGLLGTGIKKKIFFGPQENKLAANEKDSMVSPTQKEGEKNFSFLIQCININYFIIIPNNK